MRKYIISTLLLFFCGVLVASEEYEAMGDNFYQNRNQLKNGKPNVEIIDNAIYYYEKALKEKKLSDVFIFKYAKAVDFKYHYLVKDEGKKEKKYESLVTLLNENYAKYTNSKYMNYAMFLIFGRYSELIGYATAGRKGLSKIIKKSAEKLYNIDKKFEHYSACIALGRMHYKAPYIPFILTWPDIKKSKKYLEEAVKAEPNNLVARYFLADTLYEIGDKERAKKYYDSVIKAKPSKERYLEDLSIIEECKKETSDKW